MIIVLFGVAGLADAQEPGDLQSEPETSIATELQQVPLSAQPGRIDVGGVPEVLTFSDQSPSARFRLQPPSGQRLDAVVAQVLVEHITGPVTFDVTVDGQLSQTVVWSAAGGPTVQLELGNFDKDALVEVAVGPAKLDLCAEARPWKLTLHALRFVPERVQEDRAVRDYLRGDVERVVLVVPEIEASDQGSASVFSLARSDLQQSDLAALDAVAVLAAALPDDVVIDVQGDKGLVSVGGTGRIVKMKPIDHAQIQDDGNSSILVVDVDRPGEVLAELLDVDRRPSRHAPLPVSVLGSGLSAEGHQEAALEFELNHRMVGGLVDSWTVALVGSVTVPGAGESGNASVTTKLGDRVIHTASVGSSGAWWVTAYVQSLEEAETLSVTMKYALGTDECDGSDLLAFDIDPGSSITPSFRDGVTELKDLPGIVSRGYVTVAESADLPVVADVIASLQRSVVYPLQQGTGQQLVINVTERSASAAIWIEPDGQVVLEGSEAAIADLLAAIDVVGWQALKSTSAIFDPEFGGLRLGNDFLQIDASPQSPIPDALAFSDDRPLSDDPPASSNAPVFSEVQSQDGANFPGPDQLSFLAPVNDAAGTPGLIALALIAAIALVWAVRAALFEVVEPPPM